jgi:hypothetical protein
MHKESFFAAVDAAILSGASSFEVAQQFSIRAEGVRRRRSVLRREGHIIPNPTRREDARGKHVSTK